MLKMPSDNCTAELFAMVRDNGRMWTTSSALSAAQTSWRRTKILVEEDLHQPSCGGAHHQNAEVAEGPGSPEGSSIRILERHRHHCVVPRCFRFWRRRSRHASWWISEDSRRSGQRSRGGRRPLGREAKRQRKAGHPATRTVSCSCCSEREALVQKVITDYYNIIWSTEYFISRMFGL